MTATTTEATRQFGDGVTARLLAEASSRVPKHSHPPGRHPDGRCSACRWTEVRIYRNVNAGMSPAYLVEIVGNSALDGEQRYVQLETTDSAPWVVESFVAHRRDGTAYISRAARRALAEAAALDGGIDDAFVNRAVV